ncbi:pirin family protein [Biostraticola tofi]|uniref:Pirin-like protein YhaK n=1 Tax=Biostraticola tofi TaxID=466109 RepID=A0A4R3Z1L5_9GAMM|nr:pirin family protein [Biostraticola tofi]TCV98797.1 hypothetical protein EDC52_102118 [Biostraticola tofi]
MITPRTAGQCGQADYGWLQARYTFSFGHYFDPELLGFDALRVLNQELITAGAAFQPRTYPRVDILNIVLQGQAEYRDSEGRHLHAGCGDAVLLSAQPGISYSEHNPGQTPLTRLQLWLDVCPSRDNPPIQHIGRSHESLSLMASPDGANGSMQLRQQAWIRHVDLPAGEQLTLPLLANNAYLQSINGRMDIQRQTADTLHLDCGDGAFIQQESSVIIRAVTAARALLIDLARQ